MNKKLKIGIFLILFGIGMPLVLFFFQEDGTMFTITRTTTAIKNPTKDKTAELEQKIGEIVDVVTRIYEKYVTPKQRAEEIPDLDVFLEGHHNGGKIYKISAELKNLFETGKWTETTNERIDIPFRHFVGLGVLFMLLGIGFIVFSFSYFSKSKGRTP